MEGKKLALVGVGAVGGSLLGRKEGNDQIVSVIAQGDRAKRLEKEGILVNKKPCQGHLATAGDAIDLLFVAVKNTQLDEVKKEIAPFVGKETVLLPLMNGITAARTLKEAFPQNEVVTALVYVDAVKEGKDVFCGEEYLVQLGSQGDDCRAETVEMAAECLEKLGIESKIAEDIQRTLWLKWMVNMGMNQVSALMEVPFAPFQKIPALLEAAKMAMEEVVAVAKEAGVDLTMDDVWAMDEKIHGFEPEATSSMLQDVAAKRKTEVEFFAGELMRLGKQYGVATPYNALLYQLLRAKEGLYGVE